MNGMYETLAEDVLLSPANYTIMEVVLASGLIRRQKEFEEMKGRYSQMLDRLLDAEIRYERSFIGRE